MYPVIRYVKTMLQSRKRPKLSYKDQSSITFRCHPWDIDMFNEMNNGRVLTLYDLGRMDLAVRSNIMPVVMKNRWAFVVAGSAVRYRKRIKMFDKITMHTQCVGADEKWLYLEQSMWVKGMPCSSVLIRAGISSKEGLVLPTELIRALGEEVEDRTLPLWVREWIDSEQHRPWPPTLESCS